MTYPRQAGPRPAALPPERRTIGQVVAESIRFYGARFFPSLALGTPAAAMVALGSWLPGTGRTAAVLAVGALLCAAALVAAVRLVHPAARASRALPSAVAAGLVVFLPVLLARIVVFQGIYLLALAWLTVSVFAVPAVLVEGSSLPGSLRRSLALARAGVGHAAGALLTLLVTIVLTALVLTFLLRGFSDQSLRVAALVALLVVSPLFFLGAAILYEDQAARARLAATDRGGS